MIFTTFQFLVFFILVIVLFFTLPKLWQRPLLLISSYYFYMCSVPWYLTVIIGITLVDFWAGIKIEEAGTRHLKRSYLIVSILSNFGLLFTLKYAGFFEKTILNDLLGQNLRVLNFILPLGISFHTFQAVSYTVEVYRGRSPAERNLLTYALYVAFFPQMVAGPIERPYQLLPQFHTDKSLDFARLQSGLRLAMWGTFKKVAVADLLAPTVNAVYSDPHHISGPILVLATFFFSIQIYCDFSGYSDIAVGVARMMGYELVINFRQPYFAKSIGEFWHRWHISLSTWFRDYLYIPLGGNRVSQARYVSNIFVVFLISGLWHGANWTFAIWGLLHGFYFIFGRATASIRARLLSLSGLDSAGGLVNVVRILTTFALVTVAWIFFRANTIGDGFYVLTHLLSVKGFHADDLFKVGLPRFEMVLAFFMIAIMGATEWCMLRQPRFVTERWSMRSWRWGMTYGCIFATIFFGVFGHVEFIYFQF